ncbi:MAG TPA: hypothetical protein VF695_00820 [Sphingomonas sp.]|jgi:hypothetical protein
MWSWGRKQQASPEPPQSPPPVTDIIVSQSLFDSDDPHDLPYAVVEYVNYLIHTAGYERDELPREALWSFYVDYYLAQVNNGGHGQFAGNSGWREATVVDIQSGLEAMGLDEALEVFEGLMLFAHEHPDRFVAAAEAGGFGDIDPVIRDLDDRFFAGPSHAIAPANGAWLRELPNLRVVPDAEREAVLEQIAAANTAADARRAARERIAREAEERDPLVQAFKHLLTHTRPPLTYQGWTAGYPRETDEGSVHIFGVSTEAGVIQAVLSHREAVLSEGFVGPVLARVPMDTLDRAVVKKTGQSVREALFGG